MKLRVWLNREGISNAEFGRRIDRSAEAVRRYADLGRIPDAATMQVIIRETRGAVTPNDFFDMAAAIGCAA
jgi:hypothetical protein